MRCSIINMKSNRWFFCQRGSYYIGQPRLRVACLVTARPIDFAGYNMRILAIGGPQHIQSSNRGSALLAEPGLCRTHAKE